MSPIAWFRTAIKMAYRKSHGQRPGQYLMNSLFEYNPELYHLVTGTPNDPFSNDDRIDAFYDFICIQEEKYHG
jgi:hypothetical protein